MALRDYERIWLTGDGFSEEDAAWCDKRIEDDDIEYVNARLFNAQAKHVAELESVIVCACDFLDALQQDAGIGQGTAFMLRAALAHKEA